MRFEETLGISDLLKVTQQELRNKIDESLRRFHISFAQYCVLSAIEEKSQLTNADLARQCSVTPQSMSRITQGLDEAGFVEKTANPIHGLLFHFNLSKKGAKVICDAHIAVNKIEVAAVQDMSKTELQHFLASLKKCLARLKIHE